MAQRRELDERAFIADWNAGMSLADMAAKYGCASSNVSVIARKRFSLRSRHSPNALSGGDWELRGRVQVWVPA